MLGPDPEHDGKLMAHDPLCPMVETQRQMGEPLMTLFECEEELPTDLRRHSCLAPTA